MGAKKTFKRRLIMVTRKYSAALTCVADGANRNLRTMHDIDDTITSNENLANVWLADFGHHAAHLRKTRKCFNFREQFVHEIAGWSRIFSA